MGIAASTVSIAVGAVLAWGVAQSVPHANLRLIGAILMIVGAIGLIVSLALELPRRRVRETRSYRDGPPVEGREERVYVEREVF